MMRALFLGLQAPGLAPSQRFRIEAFQPYLAANGVTLDYAWALSASDIQEFYRQTRVGAKARVALRALARRALSVMPWPGHPRPDVVIVQREAFFLGGAWSERIAALRAPVVFDFDDAIWIKDVSEANRRFSFLKNVRKIPEIIRLSHTVLAGNAYLAEYARRFNQRVEVVPTCVDTDRYVPAPRSNDGTVVIGWSGSRTTFPHLKLAFPALEQLRARYGDRVGFKIVGDAAFRHNALGIVGEAWSSDSEVQALQSMDVGIMPLPDDDWSKGKCGLKGLTYMAAGIPAVMSPVGVNTEIVQDGIDGFLPRTEAEWVARLSRLVEDAALRKRMGAAGRATVVSRYSTLRWRDTVLGVLRSVARSESR